MPEYRRIAPPVLSMHLCREPQHKQYFFSSGKVLYNASATAATGACHQKYLPVGNHAAVS